jgi:hypothetical protein
MSDFFFVFCGQKCGTYISGCFGDGMSTTHDESQILLTLSLKQLRALCVQYDLPAYGSKQILVERIVNFTIVTPTVYKHKKYKIKIAFL